MTPSARLQECGIQLPITAAPIGAYVPARRCGALVYTSGQLPMEDGKLTAVGAVPTEVSVEDAQRACRIAVLNALAAAAQAVGGIDAITGIIRVGIFVNSAAGFSEQPKVANDASELLVEVFGDVGRHARAAVGVNELPMNAAVEVELLASC